MVLLAQVSAFIGTSHAAAVPAADSSWRADNKHLSSGAVVTVRADEAAFLGIQDMATDIWQTRRLGSSGELELDVQIRHDWLDRLRALPGVNASSLA